MKRMKLFLASVITIAIAPGNQATAQVQTNVPDVVTGAKPVSVEHVKIHGMALEGNLEGAPWIGTSSSFPEPCASVLQQESLLYRRVPITGTSQLATRGWLSHRHAPAGSAITCPATKVEIDNALDYRR